MLTVALNKMLPEVTVVRLIVVLVVLPVIAAPMVSKPVVAVRLIALPAGRGIRHGTGSCEVAYIGNGDAAIGSCAGGGDCQ